MDNQDDKNKILERLILSSLLGWVGWQAIGDKGRQTVVSILDTLLEKLEQQAQRQKALEMENYVWKLRLWRPWLSH